MANVEIVNRLIDLGLSQYESKCYIALLRVYPATPYRISKLAGIPLSKIYEVVKRLEKRGLIVEVEGKGKGYVPKDPETALAEWKDRYLKTLGETARELRSVIKEKPHYIAWNIRGEEEAVSQGRRLLSEARVSVSLAAPGILFDAWSDDLRHASSRGCYMSVISYEQPEHDFQEISLKILTDGAKKGIQRGTVLSIDHRAALFLAGDSVSSDFQGAWTENPAIALIAEEYVEDKLFLERAIENHWIPWGATE